MYLFKAFKATEEPELCQQFKAGHVQVLIDYGIANVTTNNDSWMQDDLVYGVVAYRVNDNKMVGGVRVHISSNNIRLPVEDAVGKMDPNIFNIITYFRENGGVGELCALWNAKEVSGLGLSLLLIRSGISIVSQLNLGSLFTICASYTMPMVKRVGFLVEDTLGKEGGFVYPNENYIAKVLRRMNAVTLESAEPYDKARIFDLRKDPLQTFDEEGPKYKVKIIYNLILN